MQLSTIIVVVTYLALLPTSALAQDAAQMKPDQIRISYIPPLNPAHQLVYEELKKLQVLEKFKELVSPLRLPRPLLVKFEGCKGETNAWYDSDEEAVTVCYELMQLSRDNAPKETTPAGVTPEDAVAGPAAEILLHETAHALFDFLEIPVLGREEDAADLVAAYILLQFRKDEARRLIAGVAYMYGNDAKKRGSHIPMNAFADEHGLPGQRYFNYICLAYGKDPELFADALTVGGLPKDRAERCVAEYDQVEFSFQKLITPYIDQSLRKKIKNKQWLRSNTAK